MKAYNLPFSVLLASCFLTACSPSSQNQTLSEATYSSKTPVPQFINDPYEPVNRRIWAANEGLLKGVIHPSARVYRSVLPLSVRGSIQNFTRNITYPGRLVNNILQGRWSGARDETSRFISNTTVGIGGLFDPATKWGIEKSEANFSQTFGKWGWRPKTYIVLPLLGPSDERNALGQLGDRASNPLNYLGQPYQSASSLGTYNQIAGASEIANQLVRIEADSYSFIRSAWTYISKDFKPRLDIQGKVDLATLQTLGAATTTAKNPDFLASHKRIKIKIPTTGRKLKFNYWLQPESAPLIYILPGLNAHSLSNLPLALAEHLYEQGYSVVSTTSVFHPEFMENASTADLPIYAPSDCKDLLVAITEMDKTLARKFPERFTKKALVGMSMGGFMALNIAIRDEESEPDLMTFDRYVAINAPVDMVHSANLVDEFVQSPRDWPEAERQNLINNTIHKAIAAGLFIKSGAPPISFDQTESEYLVGLSFRIGLRDTIYSSQIRNDHGVLQNPLSKWRREPVYNEILGYTYQDYFYKLAVPYYKEKGIDADEILRHANLRNQEQKLGKQPKIRIITNSNDFMLPSKDLKWMRKTFSPSQLFVFPQGGHLGNLNSPPVRKAVLKALNGLKHGSEITK